MNILEENCPTIEVPVIHYWNFREDAIRDGWKTESIYEGVEIEKATKLTKDGFVAHFYFTSKNPMHWSMGLWGPDSLAIEIPTLYRWDTLQRMTRICSTCSAENVDTHRVQFAKRVCGNCLVSERQRLEKPGWDN